MNKEIVNVMSQGNINNRTMLGHRNQFQEVTPEMITFKTNNRKIVINKRTGMSYYVKDDLQNQYNIFNICNKNSAKENLLNVKARQLKYKAKNETEETLTGFDTSKVSIKRKGTFLFTKHGHHHVNCFQSHLGRSSFSHLPNQSMSKMKHSEVEFILSLDKDIFKNLVVIGQIDRKFLVCTERKPNTNKKLLLLFDQHAVHERILLENIIKDYRGENGELNQIKLNSALKFPIIVNEVHFFEMLRRKLKKIGISIQVERDQQIVVTAVPVILYKFLIKQSKKSSLTLYQILRSIIKDHLTRPDSENKYSSGIPRILFEMMCSEACRGALKFGMRLSKSKCSELITDLSTCQTPFQCAHGRLNVTPAVLSNKNLKNYKDSAPMLQGLKRILDRS